MKQEIDSNKFIESDQASITVLRVGPKAKDSNSILLNDAFDFIKLNYNCPDSEKVGSGKGSCSNGNVSKDTKPAIKVLSGIVHDKYSKNKIAKSIVDRVQRLDNVKSLNNDLYCFIDEIKDTKDDFGSHRVGGTTTLSIDIKTGKIDHIIVLNEKTYNTNYFKTVKTGIEKFFKENNEPFTAAALLSNMGNDKQAYLNAICDHEIGHSKLIDYTMGLTDKSEYPKVKNFPDRNGNPQYVSDLGAYDRFAAKMADGPPEWQTIIEEAAKDGWKPPTYYSKSQKREMFAECYSIYIANRNDLLHPKILEFIKKVDRGVSK